MRKLDEILSAMTDEGCSTWMFRLGYEVQYGVDTDQDQFQFQTLAAKLARLETNFHLSSLRTVSYVQSNDDQRKEGMTTFSIWSHLLADLSSLWRWRKSQSIRRPKNQQSWPNR